MGRHTDTADVQSNSLRRNWRAVAASLPFCGAQEGTQGSGVAPIDIAIKRYSSLEYI